MLFELTRTVGKKRERFIADAEEACLITNRWGGSRVYRYSGDAVGHWYAWLETGDQSGIAWQDPKDGAWCSLDPSFDGTLHLR
jgi:hypothetical protein